MRNWLRIKPFVPLTLTLSPQGRGDKTSLATDLDLSFKF